MKPAILAGIRIAKPPSIKNKMAPSNRRVTITEPKAVPLESLCFRARTYARTTSPSRAGKIVLARKPIIVIRNSG